MVEEIECREPQLHPLVFLEVEPLIDREVAVEERRPVDVRPDDIAVVPRDRRREAGRVEVLPRREPAPRIAGDPWHECGSLCAELILGAVSDAGGGPRCVGMVYAAIADVQSTGGVA